MSQLAIFESRPARASLSSWLQRMMQLAHLLRSRVICLWHGALEVSVHSDNSPVRMRVPGRLCPPAEEGPAAPGLNRARVPIPPALRLGASLFVCWLEASRRRCRAAFSLGGVLHRSRDFFAIPLEVCYRPAHSVPRFS